MNDVHDSHHWAWTQNFNFGTCRKCGLKCGREAGGQGWPPGDWRYYGANGNYTPSRSCVRPTPKRSKADG